MTNKYIDEKNKCFKKQSCKVINSISILTLLLFFLVSCASSPKGYMPSGEQYYGGQYTSNVSSAITAIQNTSRGQTLTYEVICFGNEELYNLASVVREKKDVKLNLTISGKDFFTIGKELFKGSTSLSSIVIEASIVSIQDKAFADCTNLCSVTLPNSISRIAPSAFLNCPKIRGVLVHKDLIGLLNKTDYIVDFNSVSETSSLLSNLSSGVHQVEVYVDNDVELAILEDDLSLVPGSVSLILTVGCGDDVSSVTRKTFTKYKCVYELFLLQR